MISDIWLQFIDLALQIPPSHPYQDSLISILHELTKLPCRSNRPEAELKEIEKFSGRFWDLLPMFKWTVLECWWKAPWEEDPEVLALASRRNMMAFARWSAKEWTNINAFVARVTASELLSGVTFERVALQVLNHALEVERRVDGLDDNLPPAAVWMLYAGRWIYGNEDDGEAVRGVAMGWASQLV